jgi:hypothetical protein
MLKELTSRQVNSIDKILSSSYEESLINLSISLTLKDRQAAEYLRDMLTLTLDDADLEKDFEIEE